MYNDNFKPLKPFFCRVGAKNKSLGVIGELVPQNYKTYVEPFVGGGSVFLSLPPPEKEIINDLDKKLIDAWILLKCAVVDINKYDFPFTEDEYEKERENSHLYRRYRNQVLVDKIQKFVDKKHTKPQNKLLSYLYQSCNSFSAKGGKIYKQYPQFNRIGKVNNYKTRLQDTTILNKDYKEVISQYDSEDTFFFLDPPYEKSDGLYTSDSINYDEMNDVLCNIKGKFMLTINDSGEIRDIFKLFNIITIKVKGRSHTSKRQMGGGIRNELIITNYK